MNTAEDKMGRALLVVLVGAVLVGGFVTVAIGWVTLKLVGLL